MRKTVLAMFVFSMFGTGALANCEFSYNYGSCGYCGWNIHAYERRATELGRDGCFPCSHSFCEPGAESVAGPCPVNNATAKEVINTSEIEKDENAKKPFNLPKLYLEKNQFIALEVADKNPYAAMIISSLYDDRGFLPLPEKGPLVFGLGDIDLNPAKAKELIEKYDNHERLQQQDKKSDYMIVANYEVHRTTFDTGYLNIEMKKTDKEGREIEKILPNIRIQLKRIGGDGDNGQGPLPLTTGLFHAEQQKLFSHCHRHTTTQIPVPIHIVHPPHGRPVFVLAQASHWIGGSFA